MEDSEAISNYRRLLLWTPRAAMISILGVPNPQDVPLPQILNHSHGPRNLPPSVAVPTAPSALRNKYGSA